jgi:hypothetical protein
VTVKVKSVNTSGVGIAPEITNHPRVVMTGVEKNMTQNVANKVGKEVGGGVVMRGIDVRRAKSASQCILSRVFSLINHRKAEERQI